MHKLPWFGQVEVYSCGPHPMLKAVAKLAKEYNLACQVSLEEYMACGVGGCAGCVVEVQIDNGAAMKRVCVDGHFTLRQLARTLAHYFIE
jgi:dihydroorotate dehydrogenase electron transfer subunit